MKICVKEGKIRIRYHGFSFNANGSIIGRPSIREADYHKDFFVKVGDAFPHILHLNGYDFEEITAEFNEVE